jgi:hypothetical protein
VPERRPQKPKRAELTPATWALLIMGGVSLLLVYAGVQTGNWRGVVITEVQVLVVGAVSWYGLRGSRL